MENVHRQSCCPNTTLKPIHLDVKSYTEYQSKMYAVSDKQPVSVSINLESEQDWPDQAQLARAEQVTALKFQGKFTLHMLTFMLNKVKNLANVTVINIGLELCFGEGVITEKIMLPKLRYLVFTNFTACSNVYGLFANNIEMSSLRQLKVENGIIEKTNVNLVATIIHNTRGSLRKLCFPDTKWAAVLLNNQFPILPNLNTFRIDYLSSQGFTQITYINIEISKVFPNLTSFGSNKGFASWNDFRNLLNSTSLQTLRSGIRIPEDKYDFKLNFLKKSFPSLEDVHLSLFFNITFSKPKSCFIDGLDSLKNAFKSLQIESNCDMQLKHKLDYESRRAHRLKF